MTTSARHDEELPGPDSAGSGCAELLILACLILACGAWCYFTQTVVSAGDGYGWDGRIYADMAQRIAHGQFPVTGTVPFLYRLGTPAMAALAHVFAGTTILDSFRIVNLTASIAACWLLWVWLSCWTDKWEVRCGVTALYVFHWNCPLRFTWFYPAWTDPMFHVCLLLTLLGWHFIAQGRRLGWIAVLLATGIGPFVRESALLFALIPVVAVGPVIGRAMVSVLVLAFTWADHALTTLPGLSAALRVWGDGGGSGNFQAVTLHRYLYAWELAFGLWLVPIALGLPVVLRWLSAVPVVLLTLIGIIAISPIGQDMERYLLWAAPAVLAMVAVAATGMSKWGWRLACTVMLAYELAWTPIPNGGDPHPYYQWTATWSTAQSLAQINGHFLVVAAALFGICFVANGGLKWGYDD